MKVLSVIINRYIKLVEKTSRIKIDDELIKALHTKCIVGFWHGYSFAMNFLLKEAGEVGIRPSIIVTADKRGDYIEDIVEMYGGVALRVHDGLKMRKSLRDLIDESRSNCNPLVLSLDGPLGPIYQAKKLAFLLSHEGNRNLIGVNVKIAKKVRLRRRWDDYAIPLPFTKIEFEAHDFGVADRQLLLNYNKDKEKINKSIYSCLS